MEGAMDCECRMSNVECQKNDKARVTEERLACAACVFRASDFGFHSSFGIRHSSLSMRRSFISGDECQPIASRPSPVALSLLPGSFMAFPPARDNTLLTPARLCPTEKLVRPHPARQAP